MLEKQLEYIRKITDFKPDTAVVLGSGLGRLADVIETECIIDYRDIPDFPFSTAPTHKGRFIFGKIGDKKVAVMQGRVHLYEGYTPAEVVMPIRLLRLMGAERLLLTNASGGINKDFNVGDFMIITDHISCFVPSALSGKNDDALGPRFPDMSEVYSKRLINIIEDTAEKYNINVKKGVYLQLGGPNFETPAEIKMAGLIGADAVGMSTAIESQAAVHCGYEVAGISVISNLACGISANPITSEEVEEAANRVAPQFIKLVKEAVKEF
ncbi:MAG: purine-nucleoside phosphorylase [Eubacterium sp.]